MSTIRWRRIEPGYYAYGKTGWEIRNMQGQSVRWSGPIVNRWVAGYGHTWDVARFPTKREAQTFVEAQVTR